MDRIAVAVAAVAFAVWAVGLLLGKRKAEKEATKATEKEKVGAGARAGHPEATAEGGETEPTEAAEGPNVDPPTAWVEDITVHRPWRPNDFGPELPGEHRPELGPAPDPIITTPPGDLMSMLRRIVRRREPDAAEAERRSEVAARFKKQRPVTAQPPAAPLVKVDVPIPDARPRTGLPPGQATKAAVKVIKEFVEELELPTHLIIPQATQMRAIVSFVCEGLVRLVRLPDGKDIRTPIAKVYAYAKVASALASGLRLLHGHLVDRRHDPKVVEAVADAAAAMRQAAERVQNAADTTAKRYRGTASDQARGVRLPDFRDS